MSDDELLREFPKLPAVGDIVSVEREDGTMMQLRITEAVETEESVHYTAEEVE